MHDIYVWYTITIITPLLIYDIFMFILINHLNIINSNYLMAYSFLLKE